MTIQLPASVFRRPAPAAPHSSFRPYLRPRAGVTILAETRSEARLKSPAAMSPTLRTLCQASASRPHGSLQAWVTRSAALRQQSWPSGCLILCKSPNTRTGPRRLRQLGNTSFQPCGTVYLRSMRDRYRNIGVMLALYIAGSSREARESRHARPSSRRQTTHAWRIRRPGARHRLARCPLFIPASICSEFASGLHGERIVVAPSDASAASFNPLALASSRALFVAPGLGSCACAA